MLSNILDKVSFWSLYLVVVLLPLFFLPFTKIPIETSKSLLVVVGLSISILAWAAARFSDGQVMLPRSWVLVSGLAVVASFLAASFFSVSFKMSMFGIMLDIGSFWSMLLAYLLMLFTAITFRHKEKARVLLLGILASLLIVFCFQVLKIFAPSAFSFGQLVGKTANLAGSWNNLGLMAVLGMIISLFLVEFFSIPKVIKVILGVFIGISLFITILVNFPLAWQLLGVFSLFVFVYKISFYAGQGRLDQSQRKFPVFSFLIVLCSLLFFISGQFIGNYLPSKLGISNIEVSPTLTSTLYVAKGALRDNPVFGMGPNSFEQAWAMYKSVLINYSQYWNTSFYSGSGLIPTFLVTVGSLGILSLLVFFYLIFKSGIKKLFVSMKSSENIETTIVFVSFVFLLLVSFFYTVGITMFLLLFVFSGVLVGLVSTTKERGEIKISFLEDPRKSFFSILVLVLVMLGAAGLSFNYVQKFASAEYFGRALSAKSSEDAFRHISRALELEQNDLYFRTYSQVELIKIGELVEKSKKGQLSEEEKLGLQSSYDNAVQSANLAINYNAKNSLNWETLGSIHYAVSSLGLTNEYEKSIEAYKKATELNPLNPTLKLSIASALLSNDKSKEAKDFAAEALKLKPNYTEALVLMSKIAKANGDNSEALSYAKQALQTLPNNKDLQNYVDSLSGASTPATETPSEESKDSQKSKQ